jgi:hypothetical protein
MASGVSLDHVSLLAAPGAIEALGFRLTPPAADHGRVLLDCSYLEVTKETAAGTGAVQARGWFLRCHDLGDAATRLRSAGIAVDALRPYEGRDGTWLDLSLCGRSPLPLPTLTRRTDLPAGAWPPPLAGPHPNRAVRLTEVRLRAPDPELVAAALTSLGATAAGQSFRFADNGRVIVEDEPGSGAIVALAFERDRGAPLVLELER